MGLIKHLCKFMHIGFMMLFWHNRIKPQLGLFSKYFKDFNICMICSGMDDPNRQPPTLLDSWVL